jgi:hypothetical protein
MLARYLNYFRVRAGEEKKDLALGAIRDEIIGFE